MYGLETTAAVQFSIAEFAGVLFPESFNTAIVVKVESLFVGPFDRQEKAWLNSANFCYNHFLKRKAAQILGWKLTAPSVPAVEVDHSGQLSY